MEEDLERKVLKVMVGLWLEQRLKVLTRSRGKIPKALGCDARQVRKTILSVLGEVSEAVRTPSTKRKLDNPDAAAKVIVGTWLAEELYRLRREMGVVSKAMGIHAYKATDCILSLLGEVSEALWLAYEAEPNKREEQRS